MDALDIVPALQAVPSEDDTNTSFYLFSKFTLLEFVNATYEMFGNEVYFKINYTDICDQLDLSKVSLSYAYNYRVYKFDCYNNDDGKPVFKVYLSNE